MAARDSLLSKPEEIVGGLAIREAMAEVVSCLVVATAAPRYGSPSL